MIPRERLSRRASSSSSCADPSRSVSGDGASNRRARGRRHTIATTTTLCLTLFTTSNNNVTVSATNNNFYCGTSWDDASSNCDNRQPCPNASDEECASTPGHGCFADTLCSSAEAGHGSSGSSSAAITAMDRDDEYGGEEEEQRLVMADIIDGTTSSDSGVDPMMMILELEGDNPTDTDNPTYNVRRRRTQKEGLDNKPKNLIVTAEKDEREFCLAVMLPIL